MSGRTWVPIPDYEGRYDVSSDGLVRSWLPCRNAELPRSLAPVRDRYGYLSVNLHKPGSKRRFRVHVLVALVFHGERPDGMEVRHLDGNHLNNAVENLQYGSRSENIQDRLLHGTHPFGNRESCSRGHEYTPETMRIQSAKGRNPFRICKVCSNEARRIRRAAERSKRAA